MRITENIFRGKKITLLGLGLLGRGVNVAKFLLEQGAILTITDLKDKKTLAPSLAPLKKYKTISYTLGKHSLKDFRNKDYVVKAAGVPLDSPFVREAEKNKIPVVMDASFFTSLAKGVRIVGVTGTRGKSTTSHLVFHILSLWHKHGGPRVFLGGNVRGMATLPLLKKVTPGDIVVLELDSWQLQGFEASKQSPHISVFTNFFRDHQNYYGSMAKYFCDKASIYKHQTKKDFLITNKETHSLIKTKPIPPRGKVRIVGARQFPKGWHTKLLGDHNKENAVYAIEVAKLLGVPKEIIKKGVETFPGVPGRLEKVGEKRGISFYNDTTATTPEGVMASMHALGKKKNIVLLAGGADKNLEYKEFAKMLPEHTKALILFRGAATEKIVSLLNNPPFPVFIVDSMKKAFEIALRCAEKKDTVLLSPGAASFGIFKNEFDRGDQFTSLVKKL